MDGLIFPAELRLQESPCKKVLSSYHVRDFFAIMGRGPRAYEIGKISLVNFKLEKLL